MAPRSPTRAFEPTPALEYNKHNYSPFNHRSNMPSVDTFHSSLPKEVRFSDSTSASFRRAHSIATENVPLLPAVSSASIIPTTTFRIANPTPGIDITAYIENCRNLNEQLRQAHEAERKAWDIERTALKSRIADLEFRLNKSNDSKRRLSNESHHVGNHHTIRSDLRAIYQSHNSSARKPMTDSAVPTVAPVWKGPEATPPATRVFQTEETNGHLPRISEDEPLPSLSQQVSPTTVIENMPVPVEQVDSTLDGITLRSAALTSSFETKITSPQFGSPAYSPPATEHNEKTDNDKLHVKMSTLLSPLDEKLKRHAGHTPMILPSDEASLVQSNMTTGVHTPVVEKPSAPSPTARPPLRPSEQSDSYFSTVPDAGAGGAAIEQGRDEVFSETEEEEEEEEAEPEPQFEPKDDKPLTGPLMLDPSARTKATSSFLETLDAKLEAVRETSPDRRQSFVSVASTTDDPPEAAKKPEQSKTKSEPDDDMPRLKLKKSTNFGSAYGFSMPGVR